MKINKLAVGLVAVALVAIAASASTSSPKADVKTIELTSKNTLVLNAEVNGESVSAVMEKATELNSSLLSSITKKPIYLFLNTPGGSVQSGMELMEALKASKRPVNTVTMFAASMGFQIAQGLGNRLILNSGILMSHHATGEMGGEFGGVRPGQLDNRIRIFTQQVKEMDELTVSRTKGKQTLESYTKAYDHELWLTGAEAIEGGYADKVVKVTCDKSLDGYTTHTIEFMGIPISYDLSNCPINTSPTHIRVEIPTNRGTMDSDTFIKSQGVFGPACLNGAVNITALCALDTTLNAQRIDRIKQEFVQTFQNKHNKVIDKF